jgi:anthranilate phosphoribosyltransferase
VLGGERGPARDVVVLNAGAALVAAGTAVAVADGMTQAEAAIDDGRAAAALDRLVAASQLP